MYSGGGSGDGGGGGGGGGGGARDGVVTLQLRGADDDDEDDDKVATVDAAGTNLASVLARLQQEDATLSISYQDGEMLAEGSIDVLLGSSALHAAGRHARNTPMPNMLHNFCISETPSVKIMLKLCH